jgi:hypothetical protein
MLDTLIKAEASLHLRTIPVAEVVAVLAYRLPTMMTAVKITNQDLGRVNLTTKTSVSLLGSTDVVSDVLSYLSSVQSTKRQVEDPSK